jgi:hypothetical protein
MTRTIYFAPLSILLAVAILVVVTKEYFDPSQIVYRKIDRARYEDLKSFEAGLEIYREKYSRLPTETEGLSDLIAPQGDAQQVILRDLLQDPWGNNYVYRTTRSPPGYEVYSPGKNSIDEYGGGDDVISGPKEYSCQEYGVGCMDIPAEIEDAAVLTALLSALYLFFRGSALLASNIRAWIRAGWQ